MSTYVFIWWSILFIYPVIHVSSGRTTRSLLCLIIPVEGFVTWKPFSTLYFLLLTLGDPISQLLWQLHNVGLKKQPSPVTGRSSHTCVCVSLCVCVCVDSHQTFKQSGRAGDDDEEFLHQLCDEGQLRALWSLIGLTDNRRALNKKEHIWVILQLGPVLTT